MGLLIQAAVGSSGGMGGFPNESFGVLLVAGVEHSRAGGAQRGRLAVVDGDGGHQADRGVAVGVEVPVEGRPAVGAGAWSMSSKCSGNSSGASVC